MYDKLTKSYHVDEYMPFDVRAVLVFMLGDLNEIQQGYAGIGEYHLEQEFHSDLHVDDSHFVMTPSAS